MGISEEGTDGAEDRVMGAGDELHHGFIAQVKTAIDDHPEVVNYKELWTEQGGSGGRQKVGPAALLMLTRQFKNFLQRTMHLKLKHSCQN